jgi:hypothetical protein
MVSCRAIIRDMWYHYPLDQEWNDEAARAVLANTSLLISSALKWGLVTSQAQVQSATEWTSC